MTPGFVPAPIPRHETVAAAQHRLSADLDRIYALRADALARARACGWPGVTDATTPDLPGPMGADADPINAFLRAEIAAAAPATRRAA